MDELLKKIDIEFKLQCILLEDITFSGEYYGIIKGRIEMCLKIKQLILEDQAKRKCENCIGYGKCAIHDNFNIEYCSDFEEDIRKQ